MPGVGKRRIVGTRAILLSLLVLGVATATPADACSLPEPILSLNVSQAPPGATVHLSGGPYIESIPVEEQPSTTTTTLPGDDLSVPTCGFGTRPVTHQVITFAQGDRKVVLAEVDSDSLDIDVRIPPDATPGPATLETSARARADLTIVARSTTRTLAQTGARGTEIEALVALTTIAIGGVTLARSRRLRGVRSPS